PAPADGMKKPLAPSERGDGPGPRSKTMRTGGRSPSARRKKRRPSVGLLARGSRQDLSRPPSPSPTVNRRVGSRGRPPHTVAGPRRRLTGFPFMPGWAPKALFSFQAESNERCCDGHHRQGAVDVKRQIAGNGPHAPAHRRKKVCNNRLIPASVATL